MSSTTNTLSPIDLSEVDMTLISLIVKKSDDIFKEASKSDEFEDEEFDKELDKELINNQILLQKRNKSNNSAQQEKVEFISAINEFYLQQTLKAIKLINQNIFFLIYIGNELTKIHTVGEQSIIQTLLTKRLKSVPLRPIIGLCDQLLRTLIAKATLGVGQGSYNEFTVCFINTMTKEIANKVIVWSSTIQKQREIANGFATHTSINIHGHDHLKDVVGAIDGKLIQIEKPRVDGN
ncbi:hypothetical protein PHYBLDRAFT_70323 [Phycomyces blakesleeanus NRRL 1555(-)]|uniref:Uncharacterized protein n=1 Tax=Phycomyces blakesleeanus (strain ATCC 8743b / DSM 1359 / FGSC 10004 / NBRC 33097 / NRRL 1555) TaxID=763407 RepID=A0A167JZ92_PHYB8|nr:hypothetical protein PHYBLDRAFT_70323 [Phycomyces blakesleeanus NRRL 1555(-)]OAD66966.1 hypothetical protein PHYBLDRAFT_70323 [Phycomyces blakesleeanus NRRL 1555(-)]|eukprot:XP_018285006.1 hypothetical protein PHYBLDRAFT_70323 [Phycomyces blakesleeanus NRRL 1555(-)]